jgi:hypothetical protein
MSRIAARPRRASSSGPWRWAVATLAGLVLGLTGDGWRDIAAWVLLGLAPLVILRAHAAPPTRFLLFTSL